jgi:hypothetical protein
MMNYSYTDIILSDEGSYADEDEDDDIMTLLSTDESDRSLGQDNAQIR